MKQIIYLLFNLLIVLPILVNGQSSSQPKIKTYDKLDHIKIDNIIYYQTPYSIYANKPVETSYIPSWYWGYCAGNYPLAFTDYATEANSFILPSKSHSETKLKEYETKFKTLKPEDFPFLYVYCYGEIYFTDKKAKKQYLMLLNYKFKKESPNIEFNKIDTLKFSISKENRYKSGKEKSDIFEQVYDAPTFFDYYVLDNDGVYKQGDNVEIHKNVLQEGNGNLEVSGNPFLNFLSLLKRSPNYILSYIVNKDRVFNTVKQTPNGIIIIGDKRKQP